MYTIVNSGFGTGTTRVTSPPSQADAVMLNNVNQWVIRGNTCNTALAITTSVNCFHITGTSSAGRAQGNTVTNAAKVPTLNGFVFDSSTLNNSEGTTYYGANVTPIVDTGTNLVEPTTCLPVALTTGGTYNVPSGQRCIYFTNALVSTQTIVMPPSPASGQKMTFTWFGGVTTLTVSPNSGQQLGGAPTTSTQLTPFTWQYINGRWQRI